MCFVIPDWVGHWSPRRRRTAIRRPRLGRDWKKAQRSSLGVKAHPTLMCSIPRRAAGVNGSRVTSLCWWLMPLLKHPLVWQQRQLNNVGMPLVLTTTACRFVAKEPGALPRRLFYFIPLFFFFFQQRMEVSPSPQRRRDQRVLSNHNSRGWEEGWAFKSFFHLPLCTIFIPVSWGPPPFFFFRPSPSCWHRSL